MDQNLCQRVLGGCLILFGLTACQTLEKYSADQFLGQQTASPFSTFGYALTYPEADIGSVVINAHQQQIADPYRGLEQYSTNTLTWLAEQQALTQSYFTQLNDYQGIEQRLTEVWDYQAVSPPFHYGGYTFEPKYQQGLRYPLIYVEQEGGSRLLFDPNTLPEDQVFSLKRISVSGDGRYLAFGVTTKGQASRTWSFIEVATGRVLAQKLYGLATSPIAWDMNRGGVYYSAQAEGGKQQVMFHQLGQPQSQDQLIFSNPEQANWRYQLQVSETNDYLIVKVLQGTDHRDLIYYAALSEAEVKVQPLIDQLNGDYQFVGNDGSKLYFSTTYQAPKGRLVAIQLKQPQAEYWQTIIPEQANTMRAVALVNDHFVVNYQQDLQSRLLIYSLRGVRRQELQLPEQGTVSFITGRRFHDAFYLVFTSHIRPETVFRYDFRYAEVEPYQAPELKFTPEDYISEQVFYRSKDGTLVPMLISYRKDLARDGDNPTLMYAYGGFGIAQRPKFSPATIAWLDQGGIYAVPSIRGGGEYGQVWHNAGRLLNKQNSFDDFYGAAQYLIDQQYTSASKLGAHGLANGGLLLGAAMTQRPDLFAAFVPAVGLFDMLRFQHFGQGKTWQTEYGHLEQEAEFKALAAYSPYHQVTPKAYPAMMLMTATDDPRVSSLHSFKFAARLQQAQQGDAPILLRLDDATGRSEANSKQVKIQQTTEMYLFLLNNFH